MRTADRWVAMIALGAALLSGGCASPPPVAMDPEIRNSVEAAQAAYAAGSMDRAVHFYGSALKRAELIDSPPELARNAYNLAATLAATGNLSEAEGLLDDALAVSGGKGPTAVQAYVLKARIARGRGQKDAAWRLANDACAAAAAGADRAVRCQTRLFLTELLLDLGRTREAAVELEKVEEEMGRNSSPFLRAETERMAGTLSLASGTPAAAAAHFDAEADLLKRCGRFHDMALALISAARAYEDAASPRTAADRYLRAGRSLNAAGDAASARDAARRAQSLSEASGDSSLQRQAERLRQKTGD